MSIVAMLVFPALSVGDDDLGQDWYCSEPEAHTTAYKEHLGMHLERGAEAITDDLDKIYSDDSLTADEKKVRAIKVIMKHLTQIKSGMGD
ncbi:hypothetical protein [Desulfosediminicola sp.]